MNLTILHIAATAIIGIFIGLGMRYYQPGPKPMELHWTIVTGILGAVGIAFLGAWIGLFSLGDFMYYASAPIGAVITLLIYNIIIADE